MQILIWPQPTLWIIWFCPSTYSICCYFLNSFHFTHCCLCLLLSLGLSRTKIYKKKQYLVACSVDTAAIFMFSLYDAILHCRSVNMRLFDAACVCSRLFAFAHRKRSEQKTYGISPGIWVIKHTEGTQTQTHRHSLERNTEIMNINVWNALTFYTPLFWAFQEQAFALQEHHIATSAKGIVFFLFAQKNHIDISHMSLCWSHEILNVIAPNWNAGLRTEQQQFMKRWADSVWIVSPSKWGIGNNVAPKWQGEMISVSGVELPLGWDPEADTLCFLFFFLPSLIQSFPNQIVTYNAPVYTCKYWPQALRNERSTLSLNLNATWVFSCNLKGLISVMRSCWVITRRSLTTPTRDGSEGWQRYIHQTFFFPLILIIAWGAWAAIVVIWIITFCAFLLVIVRAHNDELVSDDI